MAHGFWAEATRRLHISHADIRAEYCSQGKTREIRSAKNEFRNYPRKTEVALITDKAAGLLFIFNSESRLFLVKPYCIPLAAFRAIAAINGLYAYYSCSIPIVVLCRLSIILSKQHRRFFSLALFSDTNWLMLLDANGHSGLFRIRFSNNFIASLFISRRECNSARQY